MDITGRIVNDIFITIINDLRGAGSILLSRAHI